MIYQLFKIGLIAVCISFLLSLQTEALEGFYTDIYIAGFVLDDKGRGIPGAAITVTHEHEKLFALRSTEAGWFESNRPLTSEYLSKKISLTVLKVGFEFAQERLLLKKVDNFIVFHLKPLTEVPINVPNEGLATGVVYGYIRDVINNRPLPAAKVSLNVDDKEIAVGYSRESGYFTLNHAVKYRNQLATYIVTHLDFEEEKGQVKLEQQNDVIRVGLFPKTGYRFITSYPLSLPFAEPPPDTEILLYGKNENYLQVSAHWGTNSKQALIGPDFWKLNLPSPHANDYDTLSFVFITKIEGLEIAKRDAILNTFLQPCTDYLDSKDVKLVEKLDQKLSAIITRTIDYKLRNTQETTEILKNIKNDLETFDPRFRDKISLLDQIEARIQQIEISRQEKGEPLLYKKFAVGLGTTPLLLINGKSWTAGIKNVDILFSWFPYKTVQWKLDFKSRFSLDFGLGLSSTRHIDAPGLSYSKMITLDHEEAISRIKNIEDGEMLKEAERTIRNDGVINAEFAFESWHVRFGGSYRIYRFFQLQTGVAILKMKLDWIDLVYPFDELPFDYDYLENTISKTRWSVYIGIGIPVLYF